MDDIEYALKKAKDVCLEHPLAAVGTAFGVGLALSGSFASGKIAGYLKENEGAIKGYLNEWIKNAISVSNNRASVS